MSKPVTLDFAYCLTREKYAEQCRQCKRDHGKYEWKEGIQVYWMGTHGPDDFTTCVNFVPFD